METITTARTLREQLARARARGATIGFVPTMGALHEGHLALVHEARKRSDFVVVSIFVNPTQFGPKEDFSRYPRNLAKDVALCEGAKVDAVFAPDVDEMYPAGDETRVRVGVLAEPLCGAFRPGHFEGVATVVAKFFGLMGPCIAVFGKKDYQQWRILERMATDLHYPVTVVGHPIVRDADGLAKSSRNQYLSAVDRARALAIPRGLGRAAAAFAGGERRTSALLATVHDEVDRVADSIDYVALHEPESLKVYAGETRTADRALLAIALRIGTTRLIDNMVLGEDSPPIVDSHLASERGG